MDKFFKLAQLAYMLATAGKVFVELYRLVKKEYDEWCAKRRRKEAGAAAGAFA